MECAISFPIKPAAGAAKEIVGGQELWELLHQFLSLN
jgi:hypothetical protein